eukprot:Sdes_comp20651_c0_seq1m15934
MVQLKKMIFGLRNPSNYSQTRHNVSDYIFAHLVQVLKTGTLFPSHVSLQEISSHRPNGKVYQATFLPEAFSDMDETFVSSMKPHFQKFGNTLSVKDMKSTFQPCCVYFVQPEDVFMNLSGPSVVSFCRKYQIASENLILVHDDAEVALGSVKFRQGHLSARGHNGVRSFLSAFQRVFWNISLFFSSQ